MKTKVKSAKANLTNQGKKNQIKLNESKCMKSTAKKVEAETRRNLQNTIKLLQYRLNIKKQTHPTSLLQLSKQIYSMIQKNIPERPKTSLVATQDSSSQSSTITGKIKDRQRSYSTHSSTILQYFKQKFGDNITDQQSVEKRLKAFQALKKSQQYANRYNSVYNNSTSSIPDMGYDIGSKQMVIGKLKKKNKE